jgi:hypothetical protein
LKTDTVQGLPYLNEEGFNEKANIMDIYSPDSSAGTVAGGLWTYRNSRANPCADSTSTANDGTSRANPRTDGCS